VHARGDRGHEPVRDAPAHPRAGERAEVGGVRDEAGQHAVERRARDAGPADRAPHVGRPRDRRDAEHPGRRQREGPPGGVAPRAAPRRLHDPQPQLGGQLGDGGAARGERLRAEVERHAGERGERAAAHGPADPVGRLEHDDAQSAPHQGAGGDEPADAAADHDRVDLLRRPVRPGVPWGARRV
jgi:hypothetical protein